MCENWNSKLFIIVKESIQYKPWTYSANITILTRFWNFILHQFLFLVMNVLNYVKLTRFFFLVIFVRNNLSFIIGSKTIPTHLENSHQNKWYYQTGEYVEVLQIKTLCTRYIIDFAVLHMFNFHILLICFAEVPKIKLCCK